MAFRFRNPTMDGSTKYGYWYGISWLVAHNTQNPDGLATCEPLHGGRALSTGRGVPWDARHTGLYAKIKRNRARW